MALAGHSAGGHLALLAASKARQSSANEAAQHPVIALAPIIDIADYAAGTGSCNAAAVRFMGGTPGEIPVLYQSATPLMHPDHVVLMGNRDRIVPAKIDYLPAGYLSWPDAGHFDWIHPGTPAWHDFLRQLQAVLR